MLGQDFIYDDKCLSEFEMIMCDPNDDQAFVSRNIDKSDITSNRPSPFHFGVTYADTLKLYFFVVKDDEIVDDKKLSEEEIHYLRSWLESPKKPTELVVITDSNDETIHYYGLFTDVQPFVVAGTCYGLYLTFDCNSPYGYSDDVVMNYQLGLGGHTYGNYYNMSAEYEEYLLPKITITSSSTFGEDESLHIRNQSDNEKIMSIFLPQGKSGIVIDCKSKMITDTDGNLLSLSVLGSSDINRPTTVLNLNTLHWLSLVPGKNKLIFTPSVGHTIENVEIRAKFIIKSGGF